MKAGEYIEFEYIKDVSTHATNETCYFQALAITIRGEEDVTNSVARKVSTGYGSVEGIARKLIQGYAGVDGVARECFSGGVKWEKYDCLVQRTYSKSGGDNWHSGGITIESDGTTIAGYGPSHNYIDFSLTDGSMTLQNLSDDYSFSTE
jgi:hypothetical protein